MSESSNVCGFISLLQIWAWERLIPMQSSPHRRAQYPPEEHTALARKWTHRRVSEDETRDVLAICRDVLDNLIEANDRLDESDSDSPLDHDGTDDEQSSGDDGHSYEDVIARGDGNISYNSNTVS
ncbi:hypothetical protein K7X08_002321 [Anisodus acutangulus]|uniref:Aminotransferase-like plant mobile domain-containing protein n=1 Tax=Anisodus acutangulus TaxID=402998 RepID=A0A9Q1R5V4_9SOLA|nr:hypothetical protein K7X08_002321 [Anisodus acutangulus]